MRMRAAGVDAELKVFDGMCHGWQLFAPMVDEGNGVDRSRCTFHQGPSGAAMNNLNWIQMLTWALAVFFVVGFVVNTFG